MAEPYVKHRFTVGPDEAGNRLDKFLCAVLPDLSRSRIQALLEQAQLQRTEPVARTITEPSHKVKQGEVYELAIPPLVESHILPQSIALDIVYEDADMLVINKPSGMTVHPAPGSPDRTLVNALLAHCGESLSGIGGVARPGIVHRIDKDTSGLLVVAKHDAAHAALSAQLAARSLKRTYLAFVWGVPRPLAGTIRGNIGRSAKNRQKMAVLRSGGKPAATHYRVREVLAGGTAALLECELETGRTHQIRVHLSHSGHSVIGDPVYGNATRNRGAALKGCPQAFDYVKQFTRQALHAWKLQLLHPTHGKLMEFSALMPKDMQELQRVLQG